MRRPAKQPGWRRLSLPPARDDDLPFPLTISLAWVECCPHDLRSSVHLLGCSEGVLILGVSSERMTRRLCAELPRIQTKLQRLLGDEVVQSVEVRRESHHARLDEGHSGRGFETRPPIGDRGLGAVEDLPDGEIKEAFRRLTRKHRERFGAARDGRPVVTPGDDQSPTA